MFYAGSTNISYCDVHCEYRKVYATIAPDEPNLLMSHSIWKKSMIMSLNVVIILSTSPIMYEKFIHMKHLMQLHVIKKNTLAHT